MKYSKLFAYIILAVLIFLLYYIYVEKNREPKRIPDYGWFEKQRAYPFAEIPNDERIKSMEYVKNYLNISENYKNTLWELVGPTNVEGRITTISIDPNNPQIIYTGCANGGVWKSTNFCQSWTSVFDNQNTSSIGALAINPLSTNIIYCGTGESNSLRSYYPGTGIYKSTNSGNNWIYIGLQNTYSIGNIVINPLNPNEMFGAAVGSIRHNNPERRIYKSTDAGNTWSLSLFVADSVGAIDVAIDPSNPAKVFAATWERTRRENYIKYGGPKSALYVTTNSGQNWNVVNGGFPSNTTTLGRISMDISVSNSQIIYALIANSSGYTDGLYKTTDGGTSWTLVNSSVAGSSNYAWFNRICKVNPTNPNQVFCGGLYMEVSANGGTSFPTVFSAIHVDHHAVCFAPSNTNFIVIGNDGGINYSTDGGSSFTESPTLPVTQFYSGDVSYQNPNVLLGGTQDNSCIMTTGSLTWNTVTSGDGFYCLIDYQNPQYMYASSQNGGLVRSTNGGSSFMSATSGLDLAYTNWSTPWIIDKNNPSILYCGTYKVHKSTNRAASWTAISPDLAKGHALNLGTITTVDVSKANPNVIYAGTDDANVWVTTNAGINWNLINAGLPNRWVTRVTIHKDSANLCYVTLSGYKIDSTGAHIFRTTNYGANWTAINSNLPDAPINDVLINPFNSNKLYIGTDYGIMETTNLGQSWAIMGNGLPSNVPVHDLTIHQPSAQIFAWTHGRSAFKTEFELIQNISNQNSIVEDFKLFQNYPNPFNSMTNIKWQMLNDGISKIIIYNVLGKKVAILVNEKLKAGTYQVSFDAGDLASGLYYYKLEVNGFTETKKMVLIK
ncbi:MAG: T9SS type A sorting domain-containing protein [Ignavibacteria bacterium]|jgi:photosystem II stability/assembly factor-like uncharacterized protein